MLEAVVVPLRARAAIVLALLAAACGSSGSGFTGSFHGTCLGQPAAAELAAAKGRVSGQLVIGQVSYAIDGSFRKERASGNVTAGEGLPFRFEASLQGDLLEWTSYLPEEKRGVQPLTFQLRRTGR